MTFEQYLNEMPVRKIELIPPHEKDNPKSNWNKNTLNWSKKDAKLVTNPNAIKKIQKIWNDTEYDFDFYLVNTKINQKYFQYGEVSEEELKAIIPEAKNITIDKNAITVFFISNNGTEKVHFSAWIAAHRFAHAIMGTRETENAFSHFYSQLQKEIQIIANKYYGVKYFDLESNQKILNLLINSIGTMKSARQGKILNLYEFAYELTAQYLLNKNPSKSGPFIHTAVIKKELPKLLYKQGYFGRETLYARLNVDNETEESKEQIDHDLFNLEYIINSYLMGIIENCVGKIFIM